MLQLRERKERMSDLPHKWEPPAFTQAKLTASECRLLKQITCTVPREPNKFSPKKDEGASFSKIWPEINQNVSGLYNIDLGLGLHTWTWESSGS